MIRNAALERLDAWPTLRLAHLPTPLVRADRLAAELGWPANDLRIKMDAETGFALGGNKVRKLEFELEPSRLEGVSSLITAGGPQSNHCRVTAAAAARLGLRCTLVLNAPEPATPTGNALLHRLFGAEIVTVSDRQERTARMASLAEERAERGEVARVVPIGASTGLGCLGYARAAIELLAQLDAEEAARPTTVYVPSSSCGTLAGLVLGAALLGRSDVRFVGVSADATSQELRSETLRIVQEGAELLGFAGTVDGEAFDVSDAQVGDGYGIPTPASDEAIALFGRAAGLVLDPTYTSKGAAEMVATLREGRLQSGTRVVFLHTGGHPGLLA